MNRGEIEKRLARRLGYSRTAVSEMLGAFFDEIGAELARGGEVRIRDFGTFCTKRYATRFRYDPNTKALVPVPQRDAVVFKPSKSLKRR